MTINDTRFLLQYQGNQADFSDASEPEQLSSDLGASSRPMMLHGGARERWSPQRRPPR